MTAMGSDAFAQRAVRQRNLRFRYEAGVTSIEYALIAALIAVAVVGAVSVTGENLTAVYDYVADAVKDVACSTVGCPP